jgi:hypothetical protein
MFNSLFSKTPFYNLRTTIGPALSRKAAPGSKNVSTAMFVLPGGSFFFMGKTMRYSARIRAPNIASKLSKCRKTTFLRQRDGDGGCVEELVQTDQGCP